MNYYLNVCWEFIERFQVHMLNQDVHKNLRRNKSGIRLDDIEKLTDNYKRPPGFTLIPNLLGTAKVNVSQQAQRKSSYFDHVQEEMMRWVDDSIG